MIKRKLLSCLLSGLLVLSVLPITVFADEAEPIADEIILEEISEETGETITEETDETITEDVPEETTEEVSEEETLDVTNATGDQGEYWYNDTTLIEYEELDSETIKILGITDFEEKLSILRIPGTIDGKKVTYIADNACTYNSGIRIIFVPDTVLEIGNDAFANNPDLITVNLNGSSLEKIGKRAFKNCTSLMYVNFNNDNSSLKIIDSYAFQGCTSMESISLPDSLESIYFGAFADCTSLQTVTLPDGLDIIYPYTFKGDTNLFSITIPKSYTTIGSNAFQDSGMITFFYEGSESDWKKVDVQYGNENFRVIYNAGLSEYRYIMLSDGTLKITGYDGCDENLTIPATIHGVPVTVLGDWAFYGKEYLRTISISEGITTIGYECFQYCQFSCITLPHSLKTIECDALPASLSLIIYNGTAEEWNQIDISDSGDMLEGVEIKYLPVSPGPTITSQPGYPMGGVNSKVTFEITATNAVSYQWYYSKDGKNWYKSSATGAKTEKLEIKVSSTNKNNEYRCKVTGTDGSSVTSDSGKVALIPGAVILHNPTSGIVKIGETVSFKVTAENVMEGGYRWIYSKDGGTKWYNSSASGYNTDTLTIKATSTNIKYLYRCVVTGWDGNSKKSGKAGFIQVSVQPVDSNTEIGKTATFTVKALDAEATYQWQYTKNGTSWYNSSATGATTGNLTPKVSTTNNSYGYRCKITDSRGLTGYTKRVGYIL